MKTNSTNRHPDFLLFIPIVMLVGIGMVMVYSASQRQSEELYDDSTVIFMKQVVALAIGAVGMAVCILIDHRIYRKKALLYCMIAAVTVLLIGTLFQDAANGARRWYYIGRFGFQPSDLAKLVIIMYVAAIATISKRVGDWMWRLLRIAPVIVVLCGLILSQPDFGTTMLILFIVTTMMFLSGIPFRILALGGMIMLPIVVGLVVTKSYRMQRIKSFMFEEHYQVRQAKLALGSGGLTGVGLAKSKQKLHFLPEPHTDFIFATLGEEFGLMGALAVIACYVTLLWRGLRVLGRVPERYSQVLGSGLLLLIIFQAFINISIALALFPNKGITLPFMSAGGTSLILSLCICGILLNISRFQVVENREA